MVSKYDPTNLFLKGYNYDVWFENKEPKDATKSDLLPVPVIEGDKEKKVKEEKGLKILTPTKLLTRFPVLLAQV